MMEAYSPHIQRGKARHISLPQRKISLTRLPSSHSRLPAQQSVVSRRAKSDFPLQSIRCCTSNVDDARGWIAEAPNRQQGSQAGRHQCIASWVICGTSLVKYEHAHLVTVIWTHPLFVDTTYIRVFRLFIGCTWRGPHSGTNKIMSQELLF